MVKRMLSLVCLILLVSAGSFAQDMMKQSGAMDMKNPNMVTIIATFPSAAAMDALVSSPKLKEAMDNGGVISKPDVKVLKAMAK
jgi:hypothetical protein